MNRFSPSCHFFILSRKACSNLVWRFEHLTNSETVQVSRAILDSLGYPTVRKLHWCNFSVVLPWLSSRRLKTFVENSTAERPNSSLFIVGIINLYLTILLISSPTVCIPKSLKIVVCSSQGLNFRFEANLLNLFQQINTNLRSKTKSNIKIN